MTKIKKYNFKCKCIFWTVKKQLNALLTSNK